MFLHHLELLAVYAGYGYTHAANVHYQTAVAVDADDIAFKTGKESGRDAKLDISTGIIFERMQQETDTFRGHLQYAHEGLHYDIGNDSRKMGTAIVYKMIAGKLRVEILLKVPWGSLKEDKAADGGPLYALDATALFLTLVYDGFMDKIAHPVAFKSFHEMADLGVVDEKVAPRKRAVLKRCSILLRVRKGTFFYYWTGYLRLRNVNALWNTDPCMECGFHSFPL